MGMLNHDFLYFSTIFRNFRMVFKYRTTQGPTQNFSENLRPEKPLIDPGPLIAIEYTEVKLMLC